MKQNPEETIQLLNRSLAPDFRLVPLHNPGSPFFLAIALPGTDATTGLKPRLPAGRGLNPQQALISAGAEALELRASLAQNHLPLLANLPRSGGLAVIRMQDLLDGSAVPVPAQEVFLDAATALSEPLLHDATSNGCAAGETLVAATDAGLWECLERDALALWWHGRRPAGSLGLDLIDPLQPRLCWWLERRDRQTRLLDLTTDLGFPVVAAVSSGPDGRLVALGAAARPLLADAALSAVTEMVQAEVGMEDARMAGDPEVQLWDAHASTLSQPQFRAHQQNPPPPVQGRALLERLADHGIRILMHQMTLPDDPLPSVRVIAHGLCAMGGRIDTPRFRRLCPEIMAPSFPEPF